MVKRQAKETTLMPGLSVRNPQTPKLARAFSSILMGNHCPNFIQVSFTAAAFHRSVLSGRR
jgi:hypothetical protein